MATEISNVDDTIDSREVIARIEELEELRDDARKAFDEAMALEENDEDHDDTEDDLALYGFDEDMAIELAELHDLAGQASGSPDWEYGETLIAE